MRNQKKYDREFKLNTVKHYKESRKSMMSISRNFEVPMGTLSGWIQEFKEKRVFLDQARSNPAMRRCIAFAKNWQI